jgi:KDO2-lipid IV(A) lauroyltransferase
VKRKINHETFIYMTNFIKPKYFLEAAIVWFLVFLSSVIPGKAVCFLGRMITKIAFLLRIRLTVVRENLKAALPEITEPERGKIINKLYRNTGEFFSEFLRPVRLDRIKMEISGEENIALAKARGKGAIILPGHLGNWELMGKKLAAYPIEAFVVAKPMQNPLVERLIKKRREKAGLGIIYQKNAVKKIVEKLHKNSFVGILMDQDAGNDGVFVPFFGREASTVPTVSILALKYDCTVLPAHLIKVSEEKYLFQIHPAIVTVRTGDKNQDILTNTRRYNEFLEAQIRRFPDQYFGWFHKRWKTKKTIKPEL